MNQNGKLPIFDTVRWSFRFVFYNFLSFLKVSLTPLLLAIVFSVVKHVSLVSGFLPNHPITNIASNLVQVLIFVPQATAWHRYALLTGAPLRWGQYAFGFKELKFCFFVLLGYGFVIATAILGITVGSFYPAAINMVQIAFLLFAVWLFCRICPILPAAAVGHRISLTSVFFNTQRQSIWITCIYLLAVIVAGITVYGFSTLGKIIASALLGSPEWVVVTAESVPGIFAYLLSVGLMITLLSSIYEQLILERPLPNE